MTFSGITIAVRLLQFLKVWWAIDVTPSGIFISARLLQPSKASLPIDVTLLGMTTEVRPEQLSNALSEIDVTLYVFPWYLTDEGIVTLPVYFWGWGVLI